MIDNVLKNTETRMQGAIHALTEELSGYRTGRASPHLVERLVVEVYGVELPLNQIAAISVPEPQQIVIRPYDAKNIHAIERAILKSDLSLTPNNDGKLIRLNIPRLTEERRRDLTKVVGKRVEEARVAVRNVRRDGLHELQKLKDGKQISEDDYYSAEDDVQELTDFYIEAINEVGKQKEVEIMEV